MNWFDAVYLDPLMGGRNTLRVGKEPGMYNTIQAAVDAVEDPSGDNPWTIIVAPGEYVEYVDLYVDESHAKPYVSLYLLPGAKLKNPPILRTRPGR
jgi:pectin methylesterase-like acyl-CoA thioesterase